MSQIKKFAYIQRMNCYNDNNICNLAPFWYNEGVLEIRKNVFKYWSMNDTVQRLTDEGFICSPVDSLSGSFEPNVFNSDIPEWYWKVYRSCFLRADAKRWYHLIPNAFIVDVPEDIREDVVSHRKLLTELIGSHPNFHKQSPDGWFVKTTRCSTKHDFKPIPVCSAEDAVEHLLNSHNVLRAIKEGANLLFRPWIREITPNCELRVFVREGKVTGVSQQFCYNMVPVLAMIQAKDMIEAAQRCYNMIANKLPIKHGFQDECTFDSYITTNDDGEVDMHLIEINSGMFGWGPAGSSLFSWVYNPPPQLDEPAVYLVAGAL